MQNYREDKIDRVRELAMQTILRVYGAGAYANVALAETLRAAQPTERDRRFLTELVYGVVKAGDTIDYMIGKYVSDLRQAQPAIRTLLRLGFYQIFFMDKIPVSAACNTAVELAKKYGRRGAASFVNGVLRTALREPERAALPKGRDARSLALREQHPLWMTERWVRAYGYERAEALCRCNNTSAPLSVRTNTLRISRTQLIEKFEAAGVKARTSAWVPEGVILRAHGALNVLAPLHEGLAQVQDESSMLVAHVLAPEPGMTRWRQPCADPALPHRAERRRTLRSGWRIAGASWHLTSMRRKSDASNATQSGSASRSLRPPCSMRGRSACITRSRPTACSLMHRAPDSAFCAASLMHAGARAPRTARHCRRSNARSLRARRRRSERAAFWYTVPVRWRTVRIQRWLSIS